MFKSLNPATLSLDVPFDEALRLARTHGFDALDLPIVELCDAVERVSPDEIKTQFSTAEVRPGGWALPVDFKRDESTYRRGLATLPRCAALAQELGSPWCFTWIWPYSDDRNYGANLAYHVRRLRPVATVLADHGCRLALEFVGPATLRAGHSHEFIHTIAEALELGERIGTGNTGLLLDSWHWYTSCATLADLDQLSGDQVIYVHVNDAPPGRDVDEQIDTERLLPGDSGVIDITGFLRALEHMSYDGPVVVEPFNKAVVTLAPEERARVVGQSLSRIWSLAALPNPI